MIVVHHLENSRSQRILWLLEELELDYEVKRYNRDATTKLAPPELLAVHPLGKSPVITDGDVTVAESGAIVEHLLEHYDNGRLLPPKGSAERRQYTYWLHYAEGTFMPYMVMSLVVGRIETAPMPFFVKPIAKGIAAKIRESFLTPNIDRNMAFMEATLASSTWFTGETMSGADILMSFPVEAAAARVGTSGDFPAMERFLKTVQSRPAYKRALEKGGPYELLGSKP